jgi:hypothetical protein
MIWVTLAAIGGVLVGYGWATARYYNHGKNLRAWQDCLEREYQATRQGGV